MHQQVMTADASLVFETPEKRRKQVRPEGIAFGVANLFAGSEGGERPNSPDFCWVCVQLI